jgi:hypothetical protein
MRDKAAHEWGTQIVFEMSKAPLRGLLCCWNLEARVGIEPTHKGFADLSLTTWVPRLETYILLKIRAQGKQALGESVSQFGGNFGAGDRGRTGDIFLGKEALYH